jgi:hypothetical protein
MRKFILVALLVIAGLVGSVAASPNTATAAPSRHACFASPVYDTGGPGLKNWRAYDPWCNGGGGVGKWWGPWRYTKGGAFIDAERHNSYTN